MANQEITSWQTPKGRKEIFDLCRECGVTELRWEKGAERLHITRQPGAVFSKPSVSVVKQVRLDPFGVPIGK